MLLMREEKCRPFPGVSNLFERYKAINKLLMKGVTNLLEGQRNGQRQTSAHGGKLGESDKFVQRYLRGMSSFHVLILTLGNVKFQHEQKLLLGFFPGVQGIPRSRL